MSPCVFCFDFTEEQELVKPIQQPDSAVNFLNFAHHVITPE